jgi:hypothetical protein
VPTIPFGGELRVREPAAETVILSGPVMVKAGLPESVAMTIMLDVPAVVGVPLTTQLDDKLNPAGRLPPVCTQV